MKIRIRKLGRRLLSLFVSAGIVMTGIGFNVKPVKAGLMTDILEGSLNPIVFETVDTAVAYGIGEAASITQNDDIGIALTAARKLIWGKDSVIAKETLHSVEHIASEMDALFDYTVNSSDIMTDKLNRLLSDDAKDEFNKNFGVVSSFNSDYSRMLKAYNRLFDAINEYGRDSSEEKREAVSAAYYNIYNNYYNGLNAEELFRSSLYDTTDGTGFLSTISPYSANQDINAPADITDPSKWMKRQDSLSIPNYLESYYNYLVTVTDFENNVYDGMTAAACVAVNGAYQYIQAYRYYTELSCIIISSDPSLSDKEKNNRISGLWNDFTQDALRLQRGLNQMLYLYQDKVFESFMRSYDTSNTVTIKNYADKATVYDVFCGYEDENGYNGIRWDIQRESIHKEKTMKNHTVGKTERIYQFKLVSEAGNTAYAIRQADGSQKLKAQHTYDNPENNSTTVVSLDVINLLKGTENGYIVPVGISDFDAISSAGNVAYDQNANRIDYIRKELGYTIDKPALPSIPFREFSSDEDDLKKGNFTLLRTKLDWDDDVSGLFGLLDDLDMHMTWNNISMPASHENNIRLDMENDIKDECDDGDMKDQDVAVLYKGTPTSLMKLHTEGSGSTSVTFQSGSLSDTDKAVESGTLLDIRVKPSPGNTVDHIFLKSKSGSVLETILSGKDAISTQEILARLTPNGNGEYEFRIPAPYQDAEIEVIYKENDPKLIPYRVTINDVTGTEDGSTVKYLVGQFGGYDYLSSKDFRKDDTVTVSVTGYYDHIATGLTLRDEMGHAQDIEVRDITDSTLTVCPSERIFQFTMPDKTLYVDPVSTRTYPVEVSDSEHIGHCFNGLQNNSISFLDGSSDYSRSPSVSFLPGERISISTEEETGYLPDRIDVYDKESRTFIPVEVSENGVAFTMPYNKVNVEIFEAERNPRHHFASLDTSADGIKLSFTDRDGWPLNVIKRQVISGTWVYVRAEVSDPEQSISGVIITDGNGRRLDFDELSGSLNRFTNEFSFKMPDEDIFISAGTGAKLPNDISSESNYLLSKPDDVIYTGEEQKQEVVLSTADGAVLKEGRDYDISYSDAVNIGNVTVTLTGKGDYTGIRTTSYKILPEAAEIRFMENPSKLYDGEPVKDPAVETSSGEEVTYSYYDSEGSLLPSAPADAGSYRVRADAQASGVYEACYAELDFTIVKGRTVIDLSAHDVEGTGEETSNSCEIRAAVFGIGAEDGTVTFKAETAEGRREVTVPVKKKGDYYAAILDKDNVPAGEYTVTASYESESGNYMSASAIKTFKERKRRTISVNELFERTYGDDGFNIGASTADKTDHDVWSYEVISDSFAAYPVGTSEYGVKPSIVVTQKGAVSVKHAGASVIKVTLSEDASDPEYHEAVAYVTVRVNKARLKVTSEAVPAYAAEGELGEVTYSLKYDGFVKGDTRNNFTHGFGTLSAVPVPVSVKASDTPYSVGIAKKGVTVNINGTELQNIFILRDYAPVYCEGSLTVIPPDYPVKTIPVSSASFDESRLNLIPDSSYRLRLTVTPKDTTNTMITWESDNEDVATITDDGLVYAVSPGETEVRATVISRSGKGDIITRSAVCRVNVGNKKTESVVLDIHEAELRVGDTLAISATAHPLDAFDAAITWSSSNEAAAAVTDGMITAKGAGEADITATAGDVEAHCHVTVADDIALADSKASENKKQDELWIGSIGSFYYTGSRIEPKPNVYFGNRLLREGTDYKLGYKDNTAAGEATLIVSPKKAYGSSQVKAGFGILPASMDMVTAQNTYGAVKEKNGACIRQELKPSVWFNGRKLKENRDYTLSYTSSEADAYMKAGSYVIKLTGKGNFDEKTSVTVQEILYDKGSRIELSKVKARLKDAEKPVYDPKEPDKIFEPAYELMYVHKENGIKAETVLKEGTDYTCSYMDNDRPGTAKAIFMATADGDYCGTKTLSFKIAKVKTDISKASGIGIAINGGNTRPYEKGGVRPGVTVTDGGLTLKEGVDYKVSYSDNKSVDGKKSPRVTVTGKGNYKGKKSVNFTIVKSSLGDMCLTIGDMRYSDKPGAYKKAKIVLTDRNGKKLTSKDYEITEWEAMSERPPAGSIVTVRLSAKPKDKKGSGCYEGDVTGSFRITGQGV